MAKKEMKEEVKIEENKESKNEEVRIMSSSEKRKNMVAVCVVAVVLIGVFVAVFMLTKGFGKSLEDKLSKNLTDMGKEFYTEFYYVEISKNKSTTEVAENLEKFKDIGIKINLDNLSRYKDGKFKDMVAEFKNEKGTACNVNNTRAIIYPESPYGKNNYKIEVELDCGFETANEAK